MRATPILLEAGLAAAAMLLAACGTNVSTDTAGAGVGASGSAAGSTGSDVGGAGASGGGTSVTGSTGAGAPDGGTDGSGGGTTDGGQSCPSAGDACTICLAAQCPSDWCACYGNLACDALLQCTHVCGPGSTGCGQMCLTAHKDGISSAYLLDDCGAAKCAAACPNTKALAPCEKCLFTKCPTSSNNCGADAECTALFTCVKACGGGMACAQGCVAMHPSGAADAKALSFCSQSNCNGTCP